MPVYQIKAPNGKTYKIDGPAGASQEDVQNEVMRQFPDAGGPASQAIAAPEMAPQAAQAGLDRGSAILEQRIKNFPEADKQRARDIYFQRTADLRAASATPAKSKLGAQFPQQRIEKSAQNRSNRSVRNIENFPGAPAGFYTALKGGLTRGAFGLPERLAAAGERFLPSAITGNTTNASYGEILNQVRANTDADLNQSLAGNIIGQVLSGGLMGGAVGKSLGLAAEGTAVGRGAQAFANAAPKTARIANAVTAGTLGGGAQAAGEGSDIKRGAAFGAVAAPIGLVAGKALAFAARPVGDLLGLPSAGKILRRFTKATREDLQIAADEFRARTGAEPTLYEILPLADRNAIGKQVFGKSPATSESVVANVRQRIANMGGEMQGSVRNATGDNRIRILGQMADDMDAARAPAAPDTAPLPGMERAAQSVSGLRNLRTAENDAIMSPIRDTRVADTIETLYPRSLQHVPNRPGETEEVYSNPEINKAINDAASTLRLRLSPDNPAAEVAGITADDIATVLQGLNKKANSGTEGAGAAAEAKNHILRMVNEDAANILRRMNEAHAGRTRMMEGMREGMETRTQASIATPTQKTDNAYESEEGTAGRQLGQTNALNREFSGTTSDVGRTLENITGSGETQRALSQNLGLQAAKDITNAAALQAQSARRLAGVARESGQETDNLDLTDLGRFVLAMHPGSLPANKLFALSRLTQLTRMPENKARTLVDLLLSQDPVKTNKAISLLNRAGNAGRQFLRDFRSGVVMGQLAGEAGNAEGAPQPDLSQVIPEASAAELLPQADGLLEVGNIDLHKRPVVQNEDGTISTVRSISVGMDDGTYLIPTVVNGKVVSNDEAIANFRLTGQHLGKFKDEVSANAYAERLHEDQAAEYGDEEPDNRPYGRAVIERLFPEAHVTDDVRDPNSKLGRKNPNSYHVKTDEAVDVRPIPGMTFEEFIQTIEDAGYTIIEKRDEVKNPVGYATGPHWHVVIG